MEFVQNIHSWGDLLVLLWRVGLSIAVSWVFGTVWAIKNRYKTEDEIRQIVREEQPTEKYSIEL